MKNAYRAGKPSEQNTPRPVIMKLSDTQENFLGFKTSPQMRGSDIFLSKYVSKETLDIRQEKFDFMEQKRRQGFQASFSGVDVILKQRRYLQTNPSSQNAQTARSTPVSVGTD